MRCAGTPYRPSNGTEGEIFQLTHCGHCRRDQETCEILTAALIFGIDDDEYPKEWRHDDDGHPTCTAFEMRKPKAPERCSKTIDMFEEGQS